jgi:hypothetical protein
MVLDGLLLALWVEDHFWAKGRRIEMRQEKGLGVERNRDQV